MDEEGRSSITHCILILFFALSLLLSSLTASNPFLLRLQNHTSAQTFAVYIISFHSLSHHPLAAPHQLTLLLQPNRTIRPPQQTPVAKRLCKQGTLPDPNLPSHPLHLSIPIPPLLLPPSTSTISPSPLSPLPNIPSLYILPVRLPLTKLPIHQHLLIQHSANHRPTKPSLRISVSITSSIICILHYNNNLEANNIHSTIWAIDSVPSNPHPSPGSSNRLVRPFPLEGFYGWQTRWSGRVLLAVVSSAGDCTGCVGD